MNQRFLPFEQPIAELEAKIEALRLVSDDNEVNISEEIARLQQKCVQLKESIFANLDPWQVTQMARHPLRPHTLDYIERLFVDFDELQGDRHCSSGAAIVGGVARFAGQTVMVLGHQKGKKTKEKIYRNFGMARPEAYRKALRLMKMAEKFKLPILTFIDTAGAYAGIDAEERNQSEAIARNLYTIATLKAPIICTVIGEGGSGGALAIGVGDRLLMLQYSVYSVITPEGCASILWKNTEKAAEAAEAMGMTAERLHTLGLVDQVIQEPLGGAHRQIDDMATSLGQALQAQLSQLQQIPVEELVEQRYQRLMAIGVDG